MMILRPLTIAFIIAMTLSVIYVYLKTILGKYVAIVYDYLLNETLFWYEAEEKAGFLIKAAFVIELIAGVIYIVR